MPHSATVTHPADKQRSHRGVCVQFKCTHLLQRVNTSGLMWNRTLLSLMEDSHLLMLITNISLNHYQCVDIYGIMTCVNVHVLMVSASRSAGRGSLRRSLILARLMLADLLRLALTLNAVSMDFIRNEQDLQHYGEEEHM